MLKTRVATALVLAPILLYAVWTFPSEWFWWVVAALVAVGGWEWSRLAGLDHPAGRFAVGALAFGATGLGLSRLPFEKILWIGAAGVALWAVNLAWLSRRHFLEGAGAGPVTLKLVVGMAVLICGGGALGLVHTAPEGRELFILLLFVIWAADIGAYAAGRLLGKHKLAPQISPGKTWEGVLGGQLLVIAVILAASWIRPELISPWPMLVWGCATAAVSVVGDLFVSLLKRQRNLKDAGSIFPGHGGVLDRFDSMLAAAPVFGLGLLLSQV